jgi:hypothetical protein
MAYENTSGMPFSGNLPFKGSGAVNGEPVNRSNAGYKTLGGACIYSGDSNNTGLVATFGVVVSTPTSDSSLYAIGKPSGYVPRGVLVADNSVMQNEPAKSGYMLQDLPITVGYEGTFTYQSWTKTQTGAIDPTPGCQIIYRATTGGTAGCAIGALEFLPAGQAVPTSFASFPGYVVQYDAVNGDVKIEVNFDNNADAEKADILPYGVPFKKTVTITSAAAATAVPILADSEVPAGKKVYVTGFIGKVNGATVWATTATVAVQDTAAVAGITCAVAAMTANALLGLNTANVTVAAPVSTGVGFTAAKGISLKGDANGTGSDFVVTVTGFIA